jgi:hypothetical protein
VLGVRQVQRNYDIGAIEGGIKKSLNRDYRRKELLKITMENQAFLRRLQV